jgi:hypothetical protein
MTDTFIFLNSDILCTAAAGNVTYIPQDLRPTKTAQEFSIQTLKYLN